MYELRQKSETRLRVEAVLERMTFMPNVKMQVLDGDHLDIWLCLTAMVPNTYRPEQTIEVASRSWVPDYALENDAAIITAITYAVRSWWIHEFDEWIRLDGKLLKDPHNPVTIERP